MKWHWVRLQLRFEAPKDVKLEMLSRRVGLSGNTSLADCRLSSLFYFYHYFFFFTFNFYSLSRRHLDQKIANIAGIITREMNRLWVAEVKSTALAAGCSKIHFVWDKNDWHKCADATRDTIRYTYIRYANIYLRPSHDDEAGIVLIMSVRVFVGLSAKNWKS